MKVVFDTNIYISAFAIPGGKAEKAYLFAIKGYYDLYTSTAILSETTQKLKIKFGWQDKQIIHFLKTIAKVASVIKPKSTIHILTDEPDNRILECACEAKVDYIITGDKHLLMLKQFQEICIISLANFINLFSFQ